MSFLQSVSLHTLAFCLFVPDIAAADERAGTPADWPPPMHDPGPFWMVRGDRLESTLTESNNDYAWALQGWWGYDRQRLRWKSEGAGEWGRRAEQAEIQALFSRLFSPYWGWQLGLRHDFRPADGRSFIVVGAQGMAPYQFEIDSAFFLSEDGDVSARFEAEYDLLLTQRLILQPRVEIDFAFSDVASSATRSGDVEGELGLRLRLEIRRELAPYIGVSYERGHAATGSYSGTRLIAGLRTWF